MSTDATSALVNFATSGLSGCQKFEESERSKVGREFNLAA